MITYKILLLKLICINIIYGKLTYVANNELVEIQDKIPEGKIECELTVLKLMPFNNT